MRDSCSKEANCEEEMGFILARCNLRSGNALEFKMEKHLETSKGQEGCEGEGTLRLWIESMRVCGMLWSCMSV